MPKELGCALVAPDSAVHNSSSHVPGQAALPGENHAPFGREGADMCRSGSPSSACHWSLHSRMQATHNPLLRTKDEVLGPVKHPHGAENAYTVPPPSPLAGQIAAPLEGQLWSPPAAKAQPAEPQLISNEPRGILTHAASPQASCAAFNMSSSTHTPLPYNQLAGSFGAHAHRTGVPPSLQPAAISAAHACASHAMGSQPAAAVHSKSDAVDGAYAPVRRPHLGPEDFSRREPVRAVRTASLAALIKRQRQAREVAGESVVGRDTSPGAAARAAPPGMFARRCVEACLGRSAPFAADEGARKGAAALNERPGPPAVGLRRDLDTATSGCDGEEQAVDVQSGSAAESCQEAAGRDHGARDRVGKHASFEVGGRGHLCLHMHDEAVCGVDGSHRGDNGGQSAAQEPGSHGASGSAHQPAANGHSARDSSAQLRRSPGGGGGDDGDGEFPRRGPPSSAPTGDAAVRPKKKPKKYDIYENLESLPEGYLLLAGATSPRGHAFGGNGRSSSAPVAKTRIDKTDVWCRLCGATSSPQWRKQDNVIVCNACGMKANRKNEEKRTMSLNRKLPTAVSPRAAASPTPEPSNGASKKRFSKNDPDRWCRNCGALSSPQWRTLSGLTVCNACGIKSKRNPVVHAVSDHFPVRPTGPIPTDTGHDYPKQSKALTNPKPSKAVASAGSGMVEDELFGAHILMGMAGAAPPPAPKVLDRPSDVPKLEPRARSEVPKKQSFRPPALTLPTKLLDAPLPPALQPFKGPKSIMQSMLGVLEADLAAEHSFEQCNARAIKMMSQMKRGGSLKPPFVMADSTMPTHAKGANGSVPRPPTISPIDPQKHTGEAFEHNLSNPPASKRKHSALDRPDRGPSKGLSAYLSGGSTAAGNSDQLPHNPLQTLKRDSSPPARPTPADGQTAVADGSPRAKQTAAPLATDGVCRNPDACEPSASPRGYTPGHTFDAVSPPPAPRDGELTAAEITFHQQHKYLVRALSMLHKQGLISKSLRVAYIASWKKGSSEDQGKWYAELWSAVEGGRAHLAVHHVHQVSGVPYTGEDGQA